MDHLDDVWYAVLKEPPPSTELSRVHAFNFLVFFANLGTNVMVIIAVQPKEFCVLNKVSA